jgi:hypothetical protein
MSHVSSNQIGEVRIFLQPNQTQWEGLDYKPKSTGSTALAFLDTASGGPFRFLQLCDKVCKLLSLGTSQGKFFKEAGEICNKGWSATIIPRVPGAFVSAKDAVVSLFNTTSAIPGAFFRRCITALQESATFVSALGYATFPFLQLTEKTSQLGKSVLHAAEVSTFVADTCDLVKNCADVTKTRTLAMKAQKLDQVSSELRLALTDTYKLNMLKTAKSICSISGFVLGLGLAVTGLAVVPGCAIMAATISLVGTLFATGASLHEEGMKYKRIQLLNDKHVLLVPEQAKNVPVCI